MTPISSYFQDQSQLHSALVHKSYSNEHPGELPNERLEFLGDSVLSIVISDRLFRLFPNLPEGELTARRSLLVQTMSLAQKSKAFGIDQLLLLSRGEEDSGGRSNNSLLANTFEAILGAMYLDSGISRVYEFLSTVFPDSELTAEVQTKDPKSLLQELTQSKGLGTPYYFTVDSSGPDHAKSFTIAVKVADKQVGTGSGPSKQRAETEAAKAALANLLSN